MSRTRPDPRTGPRRRRWVPVALFVAFVVMPVLEIWTILQVGSVIGAWWTVVLLVLDSLVGAWLVRREGARSFRAFQEATRRGSVPGREIADGALILFGGALMLTPGFLTDAFGVLLVLPLTRPVFRAALARAISRRVVPGPVAGLGGFGGFGSGGFGPPGGFGGGGRPGSPGPGDPGRDEQRPGPGPSGSVVQGEVVDDD